MINRRQDIERTGLEMVLTAAVSPTAPDEEEFYSLLQEVGMDELLYQANWHGVMPLVYERLSSVSEEVEQLLDRTQEEKLRSVSAAVLAWNLHLKAELLHLNRLLKNSEVDFLLLKGLGVAESLYSAIGSRPIGDIDLLIRKADFAAVLKLLESTGYEPFDAAPLDVQLEQGFHVPFYQPEKRVSVEVHWHISRKGHPDRIAITDPGFIDEWWARSVSCSIAGQKIRVLSPGDLLCHLSIHFLKHRFGFEGEKVRLTSRGALVQLSDIARCLVCYGSDIDWHAFRQNARRYGLLNLISVVFGVVGRTFPNDSSVIRNIAIANLPTSEEDEAIASRIATRLFSEESLLPANTQGLWRSFVISLRQIFPPPRVLAARYSISPASPVLPLYYVIRPFQLAARFGSRTKLSRFQEDLTLNRWIVGKGA